MFPHHTPAQANKINTLDLRGSIVRRPLVGIVLFETVISQIKLGTFNAGSPAELVERTSDICIAFRKVLANESLNSMYAHFIRENPPELWFHNLFNQQFLAALANSRNRDSIILNLLKIIDLLNGHHIDTRQLIPAILSVGQILTAPSKERFNPIINDENVVEILNKVSLFNIEHMQLDQLTTAVILFSRVQYPDERLGFNYPEPFFTKMIQLIGQLNHIQDCNLRAFRTDMHLLFRAQNALSQNFSFFSRNTKKHINEIIALSAEVETALSSLT